MKKYNMNDICKFCGETYGEHIYELKHDEAQCSKGIGIFMLKENDNKEKLKEIEDRLYSLNAQISLKWIGMKQIPKDFEISLLNRTLGDIIKQIREIRGE